MLKKLFFASAIFAAVIMASCSSDSDSIVDANGLTKDIKNLVPDSIMAKMKEIGMPIYTGDNPPDIQFSFHLSPMILKASNRDTDIIGKKYVNIDLKFYNQDNKKLIIESFYKEGNTTTLFTSQGNGAYIIGNSNFFTVFLSCFIENTTNNTQTLTTEVFSGEITETGVKNMYRALFMINDYGDPNNEYIEIGEGRLFYDSDGFSEKIADIQTVGIINNKTAFDINGFIGLPSTSSK